MSPTMRINRHLAVITIAVIIGLMHDRDVRVAHAHDAICNTTEPCVVTATMIQPSGDPFPPGEEILFTTDFGTFANSSTTFVALTNGQGEATAELSSAMTGLATVTAIPTYGATAQMTILFEEGAPIPPTPTAPVGFTATPTPPVGFTATPTPPVGFTATPTPPGGFTATPTPPGGFTATPTAPVGFTATPTPPGGFTATPTATAVIWLQVMPTALPTLIAEQSLDQMAAQGQAITETASGKAGIAIIASLLLWVGLRMLVWRMPWR